MPYQKRKRLHKFFPCKSGNKPSDLFPAACRELFKGGICQLSIADLNSEMCNLTGIYQQPQAVFNCSWVENINLYKDEQ